MKVFLCGGGAGMQTIEANKRLNRKVVALPEEVTLFVNGGDIEVVILKKYEQQRYVSAISTLTLPIHRTASRKPSIRQRCCFRKPLSPVITK